MINRIYFNRFDQFDCDLEQQLIEILNLYLRFEHLYWQAAGKDYKLERRAFKFILNASMEFRSINNQYLQKIQKFHHKIKILINSGDVITTKL
jgi:hypothetical protein